jgi:hypothetical protein
VECLLVLEIDGDRYEIAPLGSNAPILTLSGIKIKEDALVGIEVHVGLAQPSPVLWLQDLELTGFDSKEKIINDLGTVYKWRKDKWFRNHFGYCQFVVTQEEEENLKEYLFPHIEVLAKKFKAESAAKMLEYLEEHLDDVVKTCFSATHGMGENQPEGLASPNAIIKEAQDCLSVLERVVPQVINKPVSRLEPHNKVVALSQAHNISEKSLVWLCSHPEVFEPAVNQGFYSLKVDNRPYKLTTILEECLLDSSNIYENKVLIGLIINIRRSILRIKEFYLAEQSRFEKSKRDVEIDTIPIGYQRFDDVAARFGLPYCRYKIQQCTDILKASDRLLRMLKGLGKVEPVEGIPKLTSRFHSYPHYRVAFEAALSWYKLGNANIAGEAYLFALKSLDLLYEIYCLFRLIENLQKLRFHKEESNNLVSFTRKYRRLDTRPDRYYLFSGARGETISLWYEPEIRYGNHNSQVPGLTNLSSRYRSLQPDFVLGVSSADGKLKYAIFDAKYSNIDKTWKYHIPDLIFKYLHCLGSPMGGYSPVMFLWAFCPDFLETKLQPLQKSFNTSLMQIPCIGVAPVIPGKEDEDEIADLLKLIFKQVLVDFVEIS